MKNYELLLNCNPKLELARRHLLDFVEYTMHSYEANWHHKLLCEYLDQVVNGQVKKLMVFMPPQHGKSQLVSRHFPAYLLGKNPSLKIVGSSYSADLSTQFNRAVQRIIDSELYADVFPKTRLNSSNVVTASKGTALRNADIFETLEYFGFYKSVGVGGSLTGTPADIAIIDDPVKDAVQATSPIYQSRVLEWYEQVLETRLHNDSKIILTMTRWDKGDLAGRLLAKEDDWEVLTLEGLKERIMHPKDPRRLGEALWEKKHSFSRLESKRKKSERTFIALYQQRPDRTAKGLVFPLWETITESDFTSNKIEPIYGLDFGFSSDQLVLTEVKLDTSNIYCKELIYETGLTNSDLAKRLNALGINKNSIIYADSASPDRIAELNRYGYNVHPCIKGKDSIIAGILKINEYSLYISEKSVNLQNELLEYRYKEDVNGEPLPSVFGGKDHAIDSLRYAVFTHTTNKPQSIIVSSKTNAKSKNTRRRF